MSVKIYLYRGGLKKFLEKEKKKPKKISRTIEDFKNRKKI